MSNGYRTLQAYGKTIARWASLSIGAATAIGLALWLVGPPLSPLILASLGGSTVFLFGLTSASAAQPRALFGGHLGSTLIGIAFYQMFGDGLFVAAGAVVLTLVFMLCTKTVHPPAGANPLIMIYGHANFLALWQPVGLGILVLALVAAIWSRLDRWSAHYPVNVWEPSPPVPSVRNVSAPQSDTATGN